MTRMCRLQINTSGAWRNVVDFDLDQLDELKEAKLLDSAATMAACAQPEKPPTLRVVTTADGLQDPLMHWSASEGWKEWPCRG